MEIYGFYKYREIALVLVGLVFIWFGFGRLGFGWLVFCSFGYGWFGFGWFCLFLVGFVSIHIIPRNAVKLLALQIFILQILAEVMMNPCKGCCMSRRISRTKTGGSSKSSSSGDNTFCPYKSCRDDAVTVYDMNVEAWPTGAWKNSQLDCMFPYDETALLVLFWLGLVGFVLVSFILFCFVRFCFGQFGFGFGWIGFGWLSSG